MGYLVIGLKIGQRVQIGEIEIVISDYDQGRVDLGIRAPKHIPIDRLPTHAEKEFGNGKPGFKNHDSQRHRGAK